MDRLPAINGGMDLKVMVYEDDWRQRLHMIWVIRKACPAAKLQEFRDAAEAAEYAGIMQPEVAFISVEREDGRGCFLIKKLRSISPQTNVIAVSKEYRFEAELMKLRISGYVTQGLTKEKVIDEIENLRYRNREAEQTDQYMDY